jgi:phosphodiesterase/alkaline phosphatase D-like protein
MFASNTKRVNECRNGHFLLFVQELSLIYINNRHKNKKYNTTFCQTIRRGALLLYYFLLARFCNNFVNAMGRPILEYGTVEEMEKRARLRKNQKKSRQRKSAEKAALDLYKARMAMRKYRARLKACK